MHILQVATLFVPSLFAAGTCPKNPQALKTTRTRCEVPRQNTQKQDLKSYAQRCRLVMEWVIWEMPFQSNLFFSTHFRNPQIGVSHFSPTASSFWMPQIGRIFCAVYRRCLLQSRVMCWELRKRWRELEAWKSDETQPEIGQSQNASKSIKQSIIPPQLVNGNSNVETVSLSPQMFVQWIRICANSEGAMASWHYYIELSMDWWTCRRMVGGRTAERWNREEQSWNGTNTN